MTGLKDFAEGIVQLATGAFIVLAAGVFPVLAGEPGFEFSGFAAADLRVFPESRAHRKQSGAAFNPSLVLQPEFRYQWSGGDDRLTAIPFARLDAQDKERTHLDLRELNWLHVGDGWDMRLGVDKVFWGVAESRHLVDIINQTDLVEDMDAEEKLGQPMLNLGLQRPWGDVNLFVLPGFRERTFAGMKGRLGGAPPVDADQAFYAGGAGRRHVDLALRYAAVIEDFDIGLAYFRGVGREPRLVEGTDRTGADVYVPHYDLIDQVSLDVQATLGDWLWKLEAMGRSGQGDAFAAAVGGFEYTLYGVFGGGADIGLLAEYHYDGRDMDAPATSLEDDIFLGLRLTLNDADDTNFLAGAFIDRLNGGGFFSLEADTRLTENLKLEAEARAFANLGDKDPNFPLRRDHHLQLRLARYF